MGRSPCCEKEKGLKKGPWTTEEDQKLIAYIEQHGHGSWRALPAKAGLRRCGKSCRLRWINYLRPDIKRGKFSLQEEQTIIQLHALLGNRWSAIATHLHKRTDNEIKNYWNTHLKKRLTKMGIDPVTHKPKTDAIGSGGGAARDSVNLSHMTQWESARLEAEARLVRESKIMPNPPQDHHLGSAQLINKAMAPLTTTRPQCLDVLKAWQGVVSGLFSTTDGGKQHLESPTSTLNFSEIVVPPMSTINGVINENNILTNEIEEAIVKQGESEWKSLEKTDQLVIEEVTETMDRDPIALHETTSYAPIDVAWFTDSSHCFRASNENIMEGLSEILVCNSGDQQNPSMAVDQQNPSGGVNGGDFEENKYYWNSVFDLVDASPSDSPVFGNY